MSALNRNEKVRSEDCGIEYNRANASRHRRRCVRGVISCPEKSYFAYNQQEIFFRTSKMHVNSTPKSTKCVSCEKDYQSYYPFQQHRKKDHGLKARKTSDSVADLNKILENEMENERHKELNFQFSKLDPYLYNEKLDQVFEKLDCAAKSGDL